MAEVSKQVDGWVAGWLGGWLRKAGNKAQTQPAGAEAWLSLAKKNSCPDTINDKKNPIQSQAHKKTNKKVIFQDKFCA